MSGAEPVQGVREALAEVLRRAYLSGPRSFPHLHAADAVLASAPWQDHAGGVRALREAADARRNMTDPPTPDAIEEADWLNARADRIERDGDQAGTALVCNSYYTDGPHPSDSCTLLADHWPVPHSWERDEDHAGTTVTQWAVRAESGRMTFASEELARSAVGNGYTLGEDLSPIVAGLTRTRTIYPDVVTPWQVVK